MSLTVKAFLHDDWLREPIETRRFALDQDVATNYTYLTEKLAQVFTQVKAQDIIISYLDGEGDRITVSSDEELTDALDQFDGTIFRLHLKKRNVANDSFSPAELLFPPFFHQPRRFPFPQWNAGWCRGQRASAHDQSTSSSADQPQTEKAEKKPDEKIDEEDPQSKEKQQQEKQKGPFGGPFNFGPFGGTFELWGHPGGLGPCWEGFGQCNPSQSTKKEDESMETAEAAPSASSDAPGYTEVFEQLKAMGFDDEGGWLYELVKSKEGDLQRILDALHPSDTQKQD